MNPSIHPSAQIDPQAQVAADVSLGALSVVAAGAVLEPGCVLGAAVCVGAQARVEAGAQLGDAVVLVAGVQVGAGARIEAGAVVTRHVPARAVVQAQSARIAGYIDAPAHLPARVLPTEPGVIDSSVRGVRLHVLPQVQDMRGDLCAAEVGQHLPFVVQRSFLIYNVPSAELRGEHAHHQCHQFLVAVQGSVHVMVDDGQQREEFVLDRRHLGLHLPPMVWGTQYRYSEDAVLLVLASDRYDPQDYIRDYAEFLRLVRGGAGQP